MNRPISMTAAAAAMAVALLPIAAFAQSHIRIVEANEPGVVYGFAAAIDRVGGSSVPLADFTVGAQFTARNLVGVDRWAFGIATEAWALPGSRSILIGAENAVINEEPSNLHPKVANNVVFKNRADVGRDPGAPLNANSIAYWITAQPGTGFERGLVFGQGALVAGGPAGPRPAAIDLSDLTDEQVAGIDLIRIRKGVSLRYDPAKGELYLHREDGS